MHTNDSVARALRQKAYLDTGYRIEDIDWIFLAIVER
jgi:hypothetical protein